MLRNAATIARNPSLAREFASWVLQKSFRSEGPVRTVRGVRIGDFNGFSEYHSVSLGVSTAELAFLRQYDFGEGVFIDIGAHLGLFSLVLRERFPNRRIIAFEPAPSTFASLLRNATRNGAANIESHQLAVSDCDGIAHFIVLENARANSSLGNEASTPAGRTIEIKCTTLDRFASEAGVDRIALLKIDVEGFEISVFRGAVHILSHIRPRIVYFEICPALAEAVGFRPDEAAAFLEDNGYALHRIGDDGSLHEVRRDEIRGVILDNWVGVDTR